MTVWKYFLLWGLAFAFTSAIDALWHLVIFGKAYAKDFRPLARPAGDKITFNAPAGLLAQVLVVTTILVLVLLTTQTRGNIGLAALVGALAGVLAISVYGITNYSLMKDWSLRLTLLEAVWGPLIGGSSGVFIYWLRNFLTR
jgi:uncharacterized membrane protein